MKDNFGLVPPDIRARIEAEEYRDHQAKAGRAISEALTALHPDLELVFVRHDAAPESLPPGAVPGRWHVHKRGPIPFFAPITTPDGGYRDPDSGILRELAERDLRKPGALEKALGQVDYSAQRQLETEQRRDEMVSDFKAAKRVKGRIYRDDGSKVLRKVA